MTADSSAPVPVWGRTRWLGFRMALKRRVLVLQAVEHAQMEGASHPFKTFVRTLQDERRVDELESGITSILLRLSTLELKRRGGFRRIMFTPGEVDDLLEAVRCRSTTHHDAGCAWRRRAGL